MSMAGGSIAFFSLASAFIVLGNILLFESTPGHKDLSKSISGAKFERVAQKAEFLLYIGELGLTPELEAGHPADLLGVVQFGLGYIRRRAEMRHCIDHSLACFKGLREILCLEGGVRDHGQGFHAWNSFASKTEFVDELQDNFVVLVRVIVTRKNARD